MELIKRKHTCELYKFKITIIIQFPLIKLEFLFGIIKHVIHTKSLWRSGIKFTGNFAVNELQLIESWALHQYHSI